MKIIYLGTPDFAVKPLLSILNSKHEILAVVTQPDKPFGRKGIITPCVLKSVAVEKGLKTLSYNKIRVEGVEDLKALNPDIMVTCAYGQILSKEILEIAKYGVINIHGSLLPKYRGASPIQRAVINGEKQTGITIMQTDVGVDTGDIIYQKSININPYETAGEVFERLSSLGAEMIVETLNNIESGNYTKTKQNKSLATHTKIITKEEAVIDFSNTAENIINKICGMNPWPIAYTYFQGKILKIFTAEHTEKTGDSGVVLEADVKNGVLIGTKTTAIKVTELQLEGGKRLNFKDFVVGRKLNKGDVLGK